MIRKLTEDTFTPVTVGGGIKKGNTVKKLLRSGADKVCINGLAFTLVRLAAKKFGSQCVMASLDCGKFGKDVDWWRRMAIIIEKYGAGEILLQSVPRDGTMQGYDLELIGTVAQEVGIPVVASGGCSGYQDMYDAIDAGASAVAVGALFQFTACTPKGAAEFLSDRGVEVRL
jgi:cyclase